MTAEGVAPFRLLVIGGGFTGAVLAIHAMRHATRPLALTVIEPGRELGRGIAYGTADPTHRINVPSDRMGLFAHDPHGFTRWLFAHGHLPDADSLDGSDHYYVPRQLYGTFVGAALRDAVENARRGTTLSHRRVRAHTLTRDPGGWAVGLDDGASVSGDAVALCFGHARPQAPCLVDPAARADPAFVPDPWVQGALEGIPPHASVLIVGTGLTMVDAVGRLQRNRHAGPVTAISRHGLLPRPHGLFDASYDLFDGGPAPTTAATVLQWLRGRMRAAHPDLGWQVVADAFRAALPAIWGALPAAEKHRVVRRLLPFWEVHRFRVAPQLSQAVTAAQRNGDLRVEKGALVGLTKGERFQARIRRSVDHCETRAFEAVVLCTGPKKTLADTPLVTALLDGGLARLDDIGTGLAVDMNSRVLPPNGPGWPDLRAFGPATRGTFGEMTGAPDITRHLEHVMKDWMREAKQA